MILISLLLSVIEVPGIAGCIFVVPSRLIYVDYILIITTELGASYYFDLKAFSLKIDL